MKTVRSLLFAIFLLSLAPCLLADPIVQTFTRLFSYDPHPSSEKFPEQAPYNGKFADIEVRFIEKWTEKNDIAVLSEISFDIKALRDGKVVAETQTKPFKITANSTTGSFVGHENLGNLNFKAILDSFAHDSGGVTDLTIVFSLTYPENHLKKAQNAKADNAAASSMTLCTKLAEKADALPDKNAETKIGLYKKALMVAPAAGSSPTADNFRKTVIAKISALGGKATAPVTSPSSKPLSITTPNTDIINKQPTKTHVAKPANAQAKKLYNQARAFFAQDKGPEGREALRNALEVDPDYYDALILLGENAFNNRKFSRAKEAFDKALKINDQNADAMLKYFKACYYMGEGSDGVDRLTQIQKKYPENRSIKLALSEAYFQLGDLPNARRLCQEVLQISPSSYQAKDLLKRINRLMQ
jgi:TolA-binding protein